MVEASQTDLLQTNHEGELTDLQFDFYGRRLASSSSDSVIKVYDSTTKAELSSLSGHSGAVFSVSWSHPCYGSLLASGGNDWKAIIWKEMANNNWGIIYEYQEHEGPVSAVQWAPWELGLILLVASQDGCITTLTRVAEDKWEGSKFFAHSAGVSAVSWGPSQTNIIELSRQFVSAGADGKINVWNFNAGEFNVIFSALQDSFVRDVAWGERLIASCSDNGNVTIYAQDLQEVRVLTFDVPVWRVSWNGLILAAACADDTTRFIKKNKEWEIVSQITNQ